VNTVGPDPAQLEAFTKADPDQPLAMVNLIRFHDRAQYPAEYRAAHDDADCSGLEAYMRYGAVASAKIEALGGRTLWMGPAQQTFVGPREVEWDVVAVVFYPTRAKFFEMIADPEYQAAHVHRLAGVEHMNLIQCDGSGIES